MPKERKQFMELNSLELCTRDSHDYDKLTLRFKQVNQIGINITHVPQLQRIAFLLHRIPYALHDQLPK